MESVFIPDSAASALHLNVGERRFLSFLKEAFALQEDYIVWHEPRLERDTRPDFVIWGPQLGLVAVEVKGWRESTLVSVETETFTLNCDGEESKCKNPLSQARNYKNILINQLKRYRRPAITEVTGKYMGGLKFPVGHCVVYPGISKRGSVAEAICAVNGTRFSFFKEDLNASSLESAREFIARLQDCFTDRWNFTPLDVEAVKQLRSLISPEIIIGELDELDKIRALDFEQEMLAKDLGLGHRVIHGVAGSGKSLIIACRAKYLLRCNPKWSILVVCYNKAFVNQMKDFLKASFPEVDGSNIEVTNFHALMYSLVGKWPDRLPQESDQDNARRVGEFFADAIASGKTTKRYDALLIDEGQDFDTSWCRSLISLLNPKTGSLLFAYDSVQNIFGRSLTLKDAGINAVGRTKILKKSYRSTQEILSFAYKALGKKPRAIISDDVQLDLYPDFEERHGPPPVIVERKERLELYSYVAHSISEHLRQGVAKSNIAILHTGLSSDGRNQLLRELGKIGLCERDVFWVEGDNKKNLTLSSNSIKITHLESSKGLEFEVVFFLGLDEMPREDRKTADEKALAFVGMSRAKKYLYLPILSHAGLAGIEE